MPEAGDRRSEGVADLGARRARVLAAPFLTDSAGGLFATPEDGQPDDAGDGRHEDGRHEEVYDGAACYLRVGEAWTTFGGPVDPSGPRGPNDPLWPLDAVFGAGDDGAMVGAEEVRGEPATRYRLTVDLGLADTLLPAGVSVPAGPYRALSRLPAEVWLDAGGLARRVAVATDPIAAAETQVWAVVELWDFGVPAEITTPSRDALVSPAEAYCRVYDDTGDAASG